MAVAVDFDFGCTLVDDDRVWKQNAAQYGWADSVFFATLGGDLVRG